MARLWIQPAGEISMSGYSATGSSYDFAVVRSLSETTRGSVPATGCLTSAKSIVLVKDNDGDD